MAVYSQGVEYTKAFVGGVEYPGLLAGGLGRLAPPEPVLLPNGRATRVGSSPYFAVNETVPTGLAATTGVLWMTGQNNEVLYILDHRTGRAGSRRTPSGFGIRESSPQGLAFHDGVLYMVGSRQDYLTTIVGRSAVRVGDASRFGVGESNPGDLASHDGKLYMVGSTNDALYTLNTTTGVATQVGDGFGSVERAPAGLASHKGVLYMTGRINAALYTVDTTTGRATRVGNVSQFGVSESNPAGLASYLGTLYMLGAATGRLYTLDEAVVGPVELVAGPVSRLRDFSVFSRQGSFTIVSATITPLSTTSRIQVDIIPRTGGSDLETPGSRLTMRPSNHFRNAGTWQLVLSASRVGRVKQGTLHSLAGFNRAGVAVSQATVAAMSHVFAHGAKEGESVSVSFGYVSTSRVETMFDRSTGVKMTLTELPPE